MEASAEISGGDHAVELIVCNASPVSDSGGGEEISPLLKPGEKPKFNIFCVSHSRRKPREQVIKVHETETSMVAQFILWLWSGSRYSGLLCVVMSSTIYAVTEVLSDLHFAQPIPLFETAFARCTVIFVLSYIWLRRSGQPLFGPAHARKLLFLRAFIGSLSLFSFIYCIQRLPLSQAIVLSFTIPIMASVFARIILHEKLRIADIGASSVFSLFLDRYLLHNLEKVLNRSGEANHVTVAGSHHVYVVIVGLFSSVAGGISYCLVKAGAKASDQPVATVLSFGMLGSLAALVCAIVLEELVLPDIYSFCLMLMLGTLAFFAEVLLARGLHLEKISKAANILYIEAAVSRLWSISSSRTAPSFGGLIGCLLIVISVCCTMFVAPDKEME